MKKGILCILNGVPFRMEVDVSSERLESLPRPKPMPEQAKFFAVFIASLTLGMAIGILVGVSLFAR